MTPHQELLRDLIEMLEDAQSGFISGSGADERWKKERDNLVAQARKLLPNNHQYDR